MVSVELVVAYLTIVFIFVTIFVLCCLGCSCHIPLGKCVRCFCDETRRCCRKQSKKLIEPETAEERRRREKEAPVLAGRRRAADAKDEPPCASCLRALPWALTCGYCCGTFGDTFTSQRQLAESERETKQRKELLKGKKPPVAVGQPVFEDAAELVGTEHVVAVSMPLLAVC